ncbi:hypothetical protein DL96DRAFT_1717829 [Flagelloscypha sp. PMI_526]|nr:hypothetical protein DL96DRAFT_1717829 [Flagelloscypha sp. PMI_526]
MTPDEAKTLQNIGKSISVSAGVGFFKGLLTGGGVLQPLLHDMFTHGLAQDSFSAFSSWGLQLCYDEEFNDDFSLSLTNIEIKSREMLQNMSDLDLQNRVNVSNRLTRPVIAADNVLMVISILCSDGILVWRSWVLFGGHVVVKVVLSIFFLADLALNFYVCYYAVANLPARLVNVQVNVAISESALVLSVATNVLATSLIWLRARQHKKLLVGTNINTRQSPSLQTLILLVETGGLFCVLQFVYCVLNITNKTNYTPMDYATRAIALLTQYLAAIYPTFVLVIVHLRYSVCADSESVDWFSNSPEPSEGRRPHMSALQFAHRDDLSSIGMTTVQGTATSSPYKGNSGSQDERSVV